MDDWSEFQQSWNRLEQDLYMRAPLSQYTPSEAMEVAIVNDEQTMHGVTPIIQPDPLQPAYRDVLVITFSKR